jgi:ubiquitin conjugation factor E4 B
MENIAETFLNTMQGQPEVVLQMQSTGFIDDLVTFIVVFLTAGASSKMQSSENRVAYVKNPYLISKLVEVVFSFTWYKDGPMTFLRRVFGTHDVAKAYLAFGIIAFYIGFYSDCVWLISDVEKTGLSHQFYEKFSIRYHLSQVMYMLWNEHPVPYRERIKAESQTDVFVKFVNLIMNDTTYLLDEGLSKLTEIHSLQIEMDSPDYATLSDVRFNLMDGFDDRRNARKRKKRWKTWNAAPRRVSN